MKRSKKQKYKKRSKIIIIFKNRSKLIPFSKKSKKNTQELNDCSYIHYLNNKNYSKINKKVLKKIDNILLIKPSGSELKNFIDSINSEVIIRYAENEVADKMILPKNIDDNSSIKNIYKNSLQNNEMGRISRKIIFLIFIQYKLIQMLEKIRNLITNLNCMDFFKEKIIYNIEDAILHNNINIGYLQLKYLLQLAYD